MARSREDFGMSAAVEGRDIALSILSGDPQRGWSAFLERYEEQLKRQAGAILRWAPSLHSFGQEEDLVQGFLADQVMSRPDAMLGPAARGEQPLWPRLSRSFTNYCNQLGRSLAREQRSAREAAAQLEVATDLDEAGERDDMWPGIERRVRERQETIRLAFRDQEPGPVPLGHLLLLSESLFLARLLETSLAEADSRLSPEIPIPELVSQIGDMDSRGSRARPTPQGHFLAGRVGFLDPAGASRGRRKHLPSARGTARSVGSMDSAGTRTSHRPRWAGLMPDPLPALASAPHVESGEPSEHQRGELTPPC